MSYTMTHILIADHFLQQKAMTEQIAKPEFFLLGSIAPDAVHSRADFTFKMKADAHDLQPEETWGQIYQEKDMKKWYGRLGAFYECKKKLAQTEEEMSFLQGYIHHIFVDIMNCKLLYGENLIRYHFQVDLMRDQYRKECILQDNYLYQNYENGRMRLQEIAKVGRELTDEMLRHLELDSFIEMQNVQDNIAYHINNYEQAETASLDGLEMVSVEASKFFLQEVAKEAERMLYSFPDAERTFKLREA